MKIDSRTFIVSGGSSGLGLATVLDLLDSENTHIALLDRSPPPQDLSSNPSVKYFECDITDVVQIENAVEAAVEWSKARNAPLGGVINCAGVGTASKIIDAKNEPHSLDLWKFTIDVNLHGTFNLTRLALKHLIHATPEPDHDEERGVIIMVSSAAATAYSATKGAIRSMTLPMARDLARHHVRVVTIAPGVFASNMTASFPDKTRRSLEREGIVYPQRFGQPHEFAKTVRWALECAYVNGETIRLSGAGRLPGKL